MTQNIVDTNPWRDETKLDGFVVGYGGIKIGANRLATVFASEAEARDIAARATHNPGHGVEWIMIRHRGTAIARFEITAE